MANKKNMGLVDSLNLLFSSNQVVDPNGDNRDYVDLSKAVDFIDSHNVGIMGKSGTGYAINLLANRKAIKALREGSCTPESFYCFRKKYSEKSISMGKTGDYSVLWSTELSGDSDDDDKEDNPITPPVNNQPVYR